MKTRLIRSHFLLIGGMAASLISFPQAGGAQCAEVWQNLYRGCLGPDRIGMTVIHEGNTIEGGHYFYQKYLRDIPLTGSLVGCRITLSEPSRAQFHLDFVFNEGHQPCDFEHTVGMHGTWTSADRALSHTVALDGTEIDPGAGNGRRYGDVTGESDDAFEARVQSFLQAVLRGDETAAVRFVSYPLRANLGNGKARYLQNPTELLAVWNKLFSPPMMAKLRTVLPHDMFVKDGMAMLGDGEWWFDAKGIAVLNQDSTSYLLASSARAACPQSKDER